VQLHETGNPSATTTVSVGDDNALGRVIESPLPKIWIDRDLSWLAFNERVLAEAMDERTPLLERLKFLAIFGVNLDEFFMKRVAVVREKLNTEKLELLGRLRQRILPMLHKQAECLLKDIVPALSSHGVHLREWSELTRDQKEELSTFFDENISLALTPLVFEPEAGIPFLSNLSISVAFRLQDPEDDGHYYARIKVPPEVRAWIPVHAGCGPAEMIFVRSYQIIRENAYKLFRGMKISAATVFRATRDAEVPVNDDDDLSPRDMVREQIRQRRYEPGVRLEFCAGADPGLSRMVMERFGLLPVDVYDVASELDYSSLFQIAALDLPALRFAPWTPVVPPALAGEDDIFSAIRAADVLVHHPYDSFDASVERFIHEAASDPRTVAVKMTVYRVGDDTPFVRSLIRAAESGKQVACVIELHARFDEERNLFWATQLEKAGAHVTYGVRGLKTHAKTALVVRNEPEGLRAYAHVGTGNYNVRTARLYTDIGLLTCDPAITRDVVMLFHHLTGRSQGPDCRALLVAPTTMRERFLELVRREIDNHREGLPARIVAKMNQLEDPDLIEAICAAAQAGVPVDLIVRGFCCLRPGVAGISDGIRIRSIIGRFLEHSRMFHFAAGKEKPVDGEFYIGSADWMHRNLSRRIEIVSPVRERAARERLWEILEVCLRDRRQAWILESDGLYTRLQPAEGSEGPEGVGTHRYLMHLTRHRDEQYRNG
jgi:polyphosphate kinase